jgi:HEPN domain-containing protein
MKNNGDLAQKWLKMAEEDLAGAELWIDAGRTLAGACFHCQQAAEKSLKGWLTGHDVQAPKTHKLEQLIDLCIEIEPRFSQFSVEAAALTPYAVERRYDADFWPAIDEARSALEGARRIYQFVKDHWS